MRFALRSLLTTLLLCLTSTLSIGAPPAPELGEINGAKFRIDMPEKWNGVLVMYCHGYMTAATNFSADKRDPIISAFLDAGYAMAQSAYATTGWAIQDAMQDTEALRRYFGSKYGKPSETYVMGHSMGGFLTMALMERFPQTYDGGLPLCGPLASATFFIARHVFDYRVVFDYYFPGALPPPDSVPADYAMTPELNKQIIALLESKPEQATSLRNYTGIRTNQELGMTLVFFTYVLKDLQQRGGGNPFSNTSTIYSGTPDDNALNDGVKRYSADSKAALYLVANYTPTGRIEKPMLAIHTTYDPLVPPSVPDHYSYLARQAGSAALFAQHYVKHDGHCAITPAETIQGFEQLRAWKKSGTPPDGK